MFNVKFVGITTILGILFGVWIFSLPKETSTSTWVEATSVPYVHPTSRPVQPTPTIDAVAQRDAQIRMLFNAWDGSNMNVVRYAKSMMNNPNSFQHVDTYYYDQGDTLVVIMKFRGDNVYGSTVMDTIKVRVDVATGNVLGVE